MLWVSEKESWASNGTNIVIKKKRSGHARQNFLCHMLKLIIIGDMFYS